MGTSKDQKVKSILITQPKPESDKSPYFDLARKYNLKIDFRPFIHVEGVSGVDFRKDRISITDHQSIILTSRHAAEHFFRMCNEMRVNELEEFKYFCISESTAYYLQKFITYRKRKIFFGKQTIQDLMDVMKKHKEDKFLLPCSDILKPEITDTLEKNQIQYSRALLYKTVCSDLSDLEKVNYDVLVFFSPADIASLYKNFPKFKQNNTRIAAFGATTEQAIEEAKLRLDIYAPLPEFPSMTMALEHYIKMVNK